MLKNKKRAAPRAAAVNKYYLQHTAAPAVQP